ncbi:MAG: arsenate reductase ArsC [Caldiserica bacterium]|jgi:arsenate reductase|nr:arsenate reductase ArsC [Caldisericota bacterium]MDH7562430.1 arsenate reductase ArsC [Caldisericota bacterium]
MEKKRILFICTHNSARSQIAEGYLRERHGDLFEALSAGTHPTRVHPFAVKVMSEMGIDISNQRSKGLEEFANQKFDLVVTVCDSAKESCPFFPGAKILLHAGFPDPSEADGSEEEKLVTFRKVRDRIISWIDQNLRRLFPEELAAKPPQGQT